MKKLYALLLLALLRVYGLQAQQVDSLGLKLDAVFANVDKSQVPTRLLAEYGLPLLPLTSFNGTLADSTRTNPTLFRALYASAYTACIWGANPLASLPAYNAQVEAVEASSPTLIPIMVQRIDYATLRPEARSQNLLTVQNQQLYDVPGRSGDPYGLCTLFAAAPAHTYCPSGNVSLVFPSTRHPHAWREKIGS
ncbi:hypothetical protein GCM10027422_21780 [Hymenobacter arcticus]